MGLFKYTKKARLETVSVIADDATPAVPGQNQIPAGAKLVEIAGVTNDANDWVTLPDIASVPNGFTITILANASSNCELRTPASSNQEINSEDSDGTKEALLTAGNVYTVTKLTGTIGWMLEGRTAIGAYETAIVPD